MLQDYPLQFESLVQKRFLLLFTSRKNQWRHHTKIIPRDKIGKTNMRLKSTDLSGNFFSNIASLCGNDFLKQAHTICLYWQKSNNWFRYEAFKCLVSVKLRIKTKTSRDTYTLLPEFFATQPYIEKIPF